ncbi:acyltransferase family protein [Microbacterium immunditiarum]|uniref:Peptidoglycan/LPS O-acetylase OafA/YrhL n=1 Tax=Microbacterium immunditiarum TaxID=337480 RepID=A0A7Y9GQZ5_9MICO|nr:acyltransferase [Microbacterium immunditiarum]NYE21014.1 peptidoglycan/LPS O-acetylase OafA/YrhL [Microbacterium immunditiarum]
MVTAPTTSRAFPHSRNSLNMFRLILAAAVLFAHAFYITGNGTGPMLHGENLGGWAVAGFFVLSGFLITGSRLRHSTGEFLVHRIARIFPAFLVVLVVTALVFAPIAALLERGDLAGFWTTPVTPLEYIWGNVDLHISSYSISWTLQTVPYPGAWNGSLWTLYYEFFCYVIVWALGFLAIFRRSVWLPIALWVASVGVHATMGFWQRLGLDTDFTLLMKLLPFFLGGVVAYVVFDRWGMRAPIGIVSLALALVIVFAVPGFGGQLASPLLAYGLLWLSTVVRQPPLIAKHDVSYGFYIYAWPTAQLLVLVGAANLGVWGFIAVNVLVTLMFATASWLLIERPIMRATRRSRTATSARPARTGAEAADTPGAAGTADAAA